MTTGKQKLARNDVEVGVLSHVGMVRSENQDHYGFQEPAGDEELLAKGRLLVVCDGLGGHNGGTVASRTTVDTILESFGGSATRNLKRILAAAIDRANTAVREKGSRDVRLRNMGTTCVAAVARGSRIQIAHIGDSRAYLFRDDCIERITRDHTYLNDLIEIGLLTPEKAKHHPERNIITRCVGMGDALQVDFNVREAQPGDVFLLCTDGLYNHVEDDEMLDAVRRLEPQAACQALVDLANQRGGEDNITVGILRIVEVPPEFAAANAEETEAEPETAEHPRPVLDIDPAEPTPRTSFQQPDLTTQAVPPAIEIAARRSLKGWVILIALEVVILIVLQVLLLR